MPHSFIILAKISYKSTLISFFISMRPDIVGITTILATSIPNFLSKDSKILKKLLYIKSCVLSLRVPSRFTLSSATVFERFILLVVKS